ncbi:MAG: CaiB/BaiF CoA-transferase family protein, partial [Pseudomonadota bacterium]
DVVVENFKPGVINEMGLGYDILQEIKPDIILCSISALGQTGPLADKPGYDFIAQGYSGITSMIGEADEPPYIPLMGIGDVSTGVTAAFGIAAALLNRARTGKGQHLDIALLDCYYHYHEFNVHQYTATKGKQVPMRSGRHISYVCPAGVYRGTDGDVMVMGFLHHWPDLCAAMGQPELTEDSRFKTDSDRYAHLEELVPIIETWLQSFPDVASAVAKMESHGVPCGPILSVGETVEHPHFVQRGTIRTIEDPIAGEVKIPGMPVKTSGYPADPGYVAPTLGEHNGEVLHELLGKSDNELADLVAAGVLVSGDA